MLSVGVFLGFLNGCCPGDLDGIFLIFDYLDWGVEMRDVIILVTRFLSYLGASCSEFLLL